MDRKHIEYLTPELLYSEEPIWVNPVGGLGDIIMLSTALKRSFDKYSKICIARRTQYTEFLRIILLFKKSVILLLEAMLCATIIGCEVSLEIVLTKLCILLARFRNRRLFNQRTIYSSFDRNESSEILLQNIPWKDRNVAIVFSSESPRK